MSENCDDGFTPTTFITIPELIFDKTWANFTEDLKESLLANPNAMVRRLDGAHMLLDEFITEKNIEDSQNS